MPQLPLHGLQVLTTEAIPLRVTSLKINKNLELNTASKEMSMSVSSLIAEHCNLQGTKKLLQPCA